ncbi:MAG TPA: DUF4360 domain-containing protein [Pseudobdellovibrionaceae bacterium]|jgi:hypothetical protein
MKALHQLVISCVILSLSLSAQASVGHVTGNGGDHVRGMFLKMGEAVVSFLQQTQEGQKLLLDNHMDPQSLQKLLDIQTVSVSETSLVDNGGSDVDAIGEKGKIVLQKNRWMEHLEKERDVYYLVFHELLRALVINDDNYVISKSLLPFPKERRLTTRINPLYPLIDSERLDKVFLLEQLTVNGSGCPLNQYGTRVDFDRESNQLDISFEEYNLPLKKESPELVARKSCSLAIPTELPPNTRLIVTQMDLTANLDLSKNSDLDFGGEVFFAGENGLRMTQSVSGKDTAQKGRSLLRRNEVLKSACGGKGIFRVNTNGTLKRQNSADQTLAALGDFKLSFKLESCQ